MPDIAEPPGSRRWDRHKSCRPSGGPSIISIARCQPGRGEGTGVLEEEVTAGVVNVLGLSARVALAVRADRISCVLVPIAVERAGRVEGPCDMVEINNAVYCLLEGSLTDSAGEEAGNFEFEAVTMALVVAGENVSA